MDYENIQPPFTLQFREMSKKELKAYFAWFLESVPERVQTLARAVRSTPGFAAWEPDGSPGSLGPLGEWFASQVETRPRTEEETEAIRKRQPLPIDIADSQLTIRTFSLAMDAAMYLSQVLLKNHPSLRWGQRLGDRRSVDYGQPVVEGFRSNIPFNPVRVLVSRAYGVARSSMDAGLRAIYDSLSEKVVAN